MKKILSVTFAIIAWFAVLTQYYLMTENRIASISETTIRFLSYFTILTNSLVAIYFTLLLLKTNNRISAFVNKPGTLTAITVYITIVGLVYQIILRHIWHPTGLQMVVDELLHSIIPILVIIYWYLYENKSATAYKQIPKWLIYPLIYLAFILIRGNFANFYPYPFVDVGNLGISKVLLNSGLLLVLFSFFSVTFISVGHVIKRK